MCALAFSYWLKTVRCFSKRKVRTMTRILFSLSVLSGIASASLPVNMTASCLDRGFTDDHCYSDIEKAGCCRVCEVDSDCDYAPGLVCDNTIGMSSTNGTEVKGCNCYSFFGFHGNNTCLDSTDSEANAIKFIGLFMYILIGVWVFYNTWHCYYIAYRFRKAKRFNISKSPIQTIIFLGIALPGFAIWTAGYIMTFARLDNNMVFERSIKGPAIAVGGGFGVLGILNISIMWMNMASRSKKLTALLSKGTAGHIKVAKAVVRGYAFFFLVTTFLTLTLGLTQLGAMSSMLAQVLIAVFFLVGGRQMSKVLSKIDEKKGAAVWAAAKKISFASFIYLIGVGLYIMFEAKPFTYSILSVIGVSLLQLSLNIACHVCLNYVKSGAKTIFKPKKKRRKKVAPGVGAESSSGESEGDDTKYTSTKISELA